MRPVRSAPALLFLAFTAACNVDRPTSASERVPTRASLIEATTCTDCVFGPETFVREQGQPGYHLRNFSAAAGTGTIDVEDLNTTSDGTVTLNGVVIMEKRAVTGAVGARHVTVQVTLLANNTLEVRLTGKKGSATQVKVTQTPPPPPGDCPPDLPNPILVVESATPEEGGARYELGVTNWESYPDALFADAPELEPCGGTTGGSLTRTWVDIYSGADDSFIYGFCSLGAAADLNGMWFKLLTNDPYPGSVYIVMTDRVCGTTYTSSKVTLPPVLQ